MLHAIAIDDEPIALDVIKTLAEKISFIQLDATFTNAFQAADYLQKEKVDLIFLDIKMPDISGIDFLRSIPQPPMVVFTTAYSEHAVQSFELDAIDYLLKPFSQARFLKACNKALELHKLKTRGDGKSPAQDHIFIKSGTSQLRLPFGDILYIESLGNYVQFITAGKKITSRLTMSEAEALVPASDFIRIHRSYIAAKRHITRIEKSSIWIQQHELPVGPSYISEIEKITQ